MAEVFIIGLAFPPLGFHVVDVFLGSGAFRTLTEGDMRLAAVAFVGQGIFSSGVSLNLFTISLNFAACVGFEAAGFARELIEGEEALRVVCR